MILFKDYSTSKKSITVSGLLVTFLVTLLSFAAVVFLKADTQIVWAALAYHTVYAGLYWNKRYKVGVDGIEVANEPS